MTNTLTKRIEWIDTAKGMGLLCVILGHLRVPYLSTWIYTFHMPLFFFLSGVVFSGRKYSFKEYLIRKLKSLVLPYFSLGAVIFLFYCIVYALQGAPAADYLEMLRAFLVQEHYWTVWFLACLFLVEILYYFIHLLVGKLPAVASLISLMICIFGLLRYRLGWGSLPWNLDVAFVAQFFFHVGYLMKNAQRILERFRAMAPAGKVLILAGLALLNAAAGFGCIRVSGQSLDMSIGMYGNEILTFVSAFAGIFLIVFLSGVIKHKCLTYLGQNTMIIFAWHSRILIVLCDFACEHLGFFQGPQSQLSQLLYAAITFVIILGVLIPVTEAIKKSKLHSLFGV